MRDAPGERMAGAMSKSLNIVGLGGSVASPSKSRAALEMALSGAEDAGATTQLLDIRVNRAADL
jgi:hypothetical protein